MSVIRGTYVDTKTVAKILAQIAYAEENLGENVKANKGAIDYHLELNTPEEHKEFWDTFEDEKLILKNLFEEK